MRMNNMRFNFSKLDTPIEIYTVEANNDGSPFKPKPKLFHFCWSHVESVTLRDYQTAVQNNTLHEIKFFIRNYEGINDTMQIKHNNQMHKIDYIMPNYRNSGFTIIFTKQVK